MSKILVAVSERWTADGRVEAIGDLAQRLGSALLLLHVVYQTDTTAPGPAPGEQVLERIAAQLGGAKIKTETLLLFADDVAGALLKTAQEHQATLIVLGTATKGMLARLIEGNVSQDVVRSTSLPVLLLPADWKGGV